MPARVPAAPVGVDSNAAGRTRLGCGVPNVRVGGDLVGGCWQLLVIDPLQEDLANKNESDRVDMLAYVLRVARGPHGIHSRLSATVHAIGAKNGE